MAKIRLTVKIDVDSEKFGKEYGTEVDLREIREWIRTDINEALRNSVAYSDALKNVTVE